MSTKWDEIANESAGSWGNPGDYGSETEAAIYQSYGGCRWKCTVCCEWGSNQGHHEIHGEWDTEGRGDTPEEAVEAVRRDVFAHARDDTERAEYATMLRKLMYAAEDAED